MTTNSHRRLQRLEFFLLRKAFERARSVLTLRAICPEAL
jgi:hypothetical protein